MATAAAPSSSTSSRPSYSCVRCADRKVKCDRQRPCSACVRHNVDCVYNTSTLPRKRNKRVKDQILIDRLSQYEALLQERGIDPSKLPNTPRSEQRHKSSHSVSVGPEESQSQTPRSVESLETDLNRINKTQIVQGQGSTKFFDNPLWTRVVEEFQDPENVWEDSLDSASDPQLSDDDFGFVLGSYSDSNTRPCHPSPERILQLWQIFIERVDPLTKVIHVPTLQPAIQKAASSLANIPRSFEALMFAIYGAAVMSMKDDECQQRFFEPRKALLSRYILATKTALSRAKFMGTISLVVLQALVLHLISVRDIYEPRAVWSLTGVAVRIAQSMGLERDGALLGLSAFEAEMRRRVWWLLKTHDFRTAELNGLPKFRDIDMGTESTNGPTNINDEQLYPSMPSLLAEPNTVTDVVFVALRHELASFAAARISKFRQEGKNPSHWDLSASKTDTERIKSTSKDLEELLETKYLRYCDPSQPLHLMTMLVARSAINNIHFLTHHPRRWGSIDQTPHSERQWIWEISTKLLEQHDMLQSNPQLKPFSWHAAYFLQWHALIHVLDTLRAEPFIRKAEKTWQLIGELYENNPDLIFETRKPIHVAVGNLCLKAYGARDGVFQNGSPDSFPTPKFILQLRQQREVAKARKKARGAKSRQPEDLVSNPLESASSLAPRPDTGIVCSNDTLEPTSHQQNTMSQQPSLTQTGGPIEGDPFWFINAFDYSQVGGSNDMMNLDPDFMLSMEDNAPQGIAWEQWDAWLAESNLIRPLSSAHQHRT